MAEEVIRLVNFVSEEQLDQAKSTRGECPEDGTAQRDRPLFEILKENKDKKDAEFNERFKHRPPKALDEEETEFLEQWEMSKKEYEQHMANEEAEQLRSFQDAVAARTTSVIELKETPTPLQENTPAGRKNAPARPPSMIIKVKPQAKRAKLDQENVEVSADKLLPRSGIVEPDGEPKAANGDDKDSHNVKTGLIGLVSYSDESDDDE